MRGHLSKGEVEHASPNVRTSPVGVLAPLLRQRWRVLRRHRILAIDVAYLVVLAGLTIVGFIVGPRLRATEPALAQKLPEMSEQVQTGEIVGKILRRWGWDPARVRQAEALVRDNAEAVIARVEKAGATVLAKLTGARVVVLVPIFAFFFLKDGDRFTETVERLIASARWRRLPWSGPRSRASSSCSRACSPATPTRSCSSASSSAGGSSRIT